MEKYLAGEQVFTVEELKPALRRAVCAGKIIPVLCGSAFKNKGVQPMLDAIIDYLPSPEDVKAIKGFTPSGEEASREPDENAPFSALAFKVMNDPFVGKLTFLRVYSGKLEAGSYVMNSVKGKRERISRLVQLQADQRTDVQEVFAGDIVAAVGLKDTTTGDTLCADSAPIILEAMNFPEPVISVAIEPKTKATPTVSACPWANWLKKIRPSRFVSTTKQVRRSSPEWANCTWKSLLTVCFANSKSKPTLVSCKSRTAKRSKSMSDNKASSSVSRWNVVGWRYCTLEIDPLPSGTGFEFVNKIVGGAIPKEYIPAVEKAACNLVPGRLWRIIRILSICVTLVWRFVPRSDRQKWRSRLLVRSASKKAS